MFPRFIVLIQNLVVSGECICEVLRFWELIRLTMSLRTAVRTITLTRVANRTIGIHRKIC